MEKGQNAKRKGDNLDMKQIQIVILFCILIMLMSIRVSINTWAEKLLLTKVTTVNHIYKYDVQSYGLVSLNDKLNLKTTDYIKEK